MKRISELTRRMVLAGGIVAAAATVSSLATAQEVSFQGKTIEIMVNFAAGGGTDTAARLVAPYVARHLPGNPDVIVTNKGGAGGTAAVDFLINSVPPDGIHVGYFAGTPLRWALAMQQVPEGTGDLQFVGGRSVNQIIQARTEAELNVDTLKGYDKPLFLAINSPDNHIAIRSRMFADAMGWADFTVISGYRGQGKMVAAVRSGEADLAQTNDSFFGANREAITGDGVMAPLAQMGEYVDGKIVAQTGLEDIPVFDELWRSLGPDTVDSAAYQGWEAIHIAMSIQNVFVLPPNTPEEYVPVWSEAVANAYTDPDYLKQLTDIGVPTPAAVGHQEVKDRMQRIQTLFVNVDVRAAIESAIARNQE